MGREVSAFLGAKVFNSWVYGPYLAKLNISIIYCQLIVTLFLCSCIVEFAIVSSVSSVLIFITLTMNAAYRPKHVVDAETSTLSV